MAVSSAKFRWLLGSVAGVAVVIFLFRSNDDHPIQRYLLATPQYMDIEPNDIGLTLTNTRLALRQIETVASLLELKKEENWSVQLLEGNEYQQGEGYQLKIGEERIQVTAYDLAGLYYAKGTLKQLLDYSISESAGLPTLHIEDHPDFERRGYMLDISRDKVPTMESLLRLVDVVAMLKYNELQLYTEHTFAYRDHRVVWEDASPMTAEEIQALDRYCRDRFIDLVPNQNSFGHMEKWLEHHAYAHLAECPVECETAIGKIGRTTLDPTSSDALGFMSGLYAELLPNFSSSQFNIGCDETWELCAGRSSEACSKLGKEKVYLNFISKLNNAANIQGKNCQFWVDMVLDHPEMIPGIPKNMTAMVWNYQSHHWFEKDLYKIAGEGLDLYVCPGTNGWRSEIGRNEQAFNNMKRAAVAGNRFNAKGYLLTNWGDYGHFQPLSVTYPAILVGASQAWNSEGATTEDLEFKLNHFVYKDPTSNFAKAILKLGNAYLAADLPEGNSSVFHLMLRRYAWTLEGNAQTREMTQEGLKLAMQEVRAGLELLQNAAPTSWDSAILLAETEQAARLAMHGVYLGQERLASPDGSVDQIPMETRQGLASELQELIAGHEQLWIMRNRVGGAASSSAKLGALLQAYQSTSRPGTN